MKWFIARVVPVAVASACAGGMSVESCPECEDADLQDTVDQGCTPGTSTSYDSCPADHICLAAEGRCVALDSQTYEMSDFRLEVPLLDESGREYEAPELFVLELEFRRNDQPVMLLATPEVWIAVDEEGRPDHYVARYDVKWNLDVELGDRLTVSSWFPILDCDLTLTADRLRDGILGCGNKVGKQETRLSFDVLAVAERTDLD